MQKKANTGVNAAMLVAIIGGLIVLYMLFLPTSEREKLLADEDSQPPDGTEESVLLKASPGFLSTSQGLEQEKSIPDIFLVESTSAKELERPNPFFVRNGWLDKKTGRIEFGITDLENTDNVLLTFSAKKKAVAY